MTKHIDVIAIGALLCGIALYSQVRNSPIIEVIPQQRVALAQAIQRATRCSRAARVAKPNRLLVAPEIRVLPQITITND